MVLVPVRVGTGLSSLGQVVDGKDTGSFPST